MKEYAQRVSSSLAFYSVARYQTTHINALRECNWREGQLFTNRKTGNEVAIFTLNL